MKLLIPWTVAFFCGCIAYVCCGGRVLAPDCGPARHYCVAGDFCCPLSYECADGGCLAPPSPETAPPEPSLSTDPALGGNSTAGPTPAPRGQ